jgi:hypothetical protein
VQEFLAGELFTATVALHDREAVTNDAFRGAIPVSAFQAFATTPDARTFLADSRIDHFVLDRGTFGAAHGLGVTTTYT